MGRVALVTGGSRGIGAAISKALKAEGYEVAATYAGNDEKAKAFTDETGIKTYKWNVADYESSKEGLAQVEADLGPIEVVVANAGITRDAPFHKMTPQQWQEVIDTNLTGVFNTVHPLWPGMRERGFGRIIVISSINGQKGQFAQVNYAATKAGDLGIVKSLAQEGAGKGITANAICPGYIATEMVMAVPEKVREAIIGQIPAGRLGEPEEIAGALADAETELHAGGLRSEDLYLRVAPGGWRWVVALALFSTLGVSGKLPKGALIRHFGDAAVRAGWIGFLIGVIIFCSIVDPSSPEFIEYLLRALAVATLTPLYGYGLQFLAKIAAPQG